MIPLLGILAAGAGALGMMLVIGHLVVAAGTRLDRRELLAFSLPAGVAAEAAIAFAAFLLGRSNRLFMLLAWLAVAACAGVAARRRGRLSAPRSRWFAGAAILWLMLVCAQVLLPVYRGGYWYGDWWMHFDIAQFYLGLRDPAVRYFGVYAIPSRTPLFNLAAAFNLTVFGNQFAVYQMAALTASLAFLGPLALLAGRVRPGVVLFLVACSPFLTNNLLFPWPKLLAAAYVLAALYFYLRVRDRRRPAGAAAAAGWGLAAGLAVLAHTSAVLYALAMALDFACSWLRRPDAAGLRRAFAGAAAAGLALLPWAAWAGRTFGLRSLWTSAPTLAVAQAGGTGGRWLVDRVWNAAGTLAPLALFHALEANRLPVFPGWYGPDLWDGLQNFYFSGLLGGVTMTLAVVLLLGLLQPGLRRRALAGQERLAWLLLVCGFLGGILLQPGRESIGGAQLGLAAESMSPLILLALLLALRMLAQISIAWGRLVAAGVLMEFTLVEVAHMAVEAADPVYLADPNLALKLEKTLGFARDLAGSGWPIAGAGACLALVWLIWYGLADLSRPAGGAPEPTPAGTAGMRPDTGRRPARLWWLGLAAAGLGLGALVYGPVLRQWAGCIAGRGAACGPSRVAGVNFVHGPSLRGYDLPSAEAATGSVVHLNLYWVSRPEVTGNLEGFVHIRNARPGGPVNPATGGDMWAQEDHIAEGEVLKQNDRPGRPTESRYRIELPVGMPSGSYMVEAGWLDPGTGQQLEPEPETVTPPLRVVWRSVQVATIVVH